MMSIEVPEKCWAYKKYNKIISGIYLVLILQLLGLIFISHIIFKFSNPTLVKTLYSFLSANLAVLGIVAHDNGVQKMTTLCRVESLCCGSHMES